MSKDWRPKLLISHFYWLLSKSENLIKKRPYATTIVGGLMSYATAIGLPIFIAYSFKLQLSKGISSFLVVLLLSLVGSVSIIWTHWTLAKFCENKICSTLNFLGAMIFPTLMLGAYNALILLRGMD